MPIVPTLVTLLLLFICSSVNLSQPARQSCALEARGATAPDALDRLFDCLWGKQVANSTVYKAVRRANWQSRAGYRPLAPLLVPRVTWADIGSDPRYKTLAALLPLFEPLQGVHEKWNITKTRAVNSFLNTLRKSPIVGDTYLTLSRGGYLARRGVHSYSDFVGTFLRKLWFTPYGRKSHNHRRHIYDTTGFEHVFAGELKEDRSAVTGFHSWIQFFLEERNRQIVYYGRHSGGVVSTASAAAIKFQWRGLFKTYSTMFFGTPPDYDMMVFTACFLTQPDRPCPLRIAGARLSVLTHEVRQIRGVLATAYLDVDGKSRRSSAYAMDSDVEDDD